MTQVRLGIDVACRADHQAGLADERGEFIFSGWRFRTTRLIWSGCGPSCRPTPRWW